MTELINYNISNKYNINEKIGLYKENLIKFIIEQKNKIIMIGSIEEIDYIVGILFLTETNRYCKLNKITIHGYYLAYTFINIFNKIRKRLYGLYTFEINDLTHFIISLTKNIDYLCSRVESLNPTKNKILNGLAKFQIDILTLLNEIFEYNKNHQDYDNSNNYPNEKLNNKPNDNPNNYCNINCMNCWINILSKFFYLLLQTAKFLGSGTYYEPNLLRISDYYANIFFILFKSEEINFINTLTKKSFTEIYETYLNYKNKLNYSLIELNLNSETLDEIIKYIDKQIVENLSIVIK
jgi:hypothetical protein